MTRTNQPCPSGSTARVVHTAQELRDVLAELAPGAEVTVARPTATPYSAAPPIPIVLIPREVTVPASELCPRPSKFWGFILAAFHEHGWGVREAARALGEQERDLEALVRANKLPPLSKRRRWARALGYAETISFEADWRRTSVQLVTGATDESGRRLVKIVNKAPAGEPWDYEESEGDSGVGFDYVEVPEHLRDLAQQELFAFIVVGRSMSPAYEPGDLVFALPSEATGRISDMPEGAAVFARFAPEEPAHPGRCTFKCYGVHPDPRRMRLSPLNPEAGGPIEPLREHVVRLAAAVHVEKGWWRVPAGTVQRWGRGRRLERDAIDRVG